MKTQSNFAQKSKSKKEVRPVNLPSFNVQSVAFAGTNVTASTGCGQCCTG